MDLGESFNKSRAYEGNYTGYVIGKVPGTDSCYKAKAFADNGSGLPDFTIEYNDTTGISTKTCSIKDGIGCDSNKEW